MVKLSSQIDISMPSPVIETKFTPQLLIPCEAPYRDETRHHFPCIDAIKARHDVENVRIFEEFAEAVSAAQSRVLIIDRHLFSEDGENPDHRGRIEKVVNWFFTEQLRSVKILTGHHGSQKYIEDNFKQLQETVIELRGKLGTPINIELSFSLKDFNYIHDRFAIVDDELWHFGATVGGFHRDVNAASRGWNAETLRAVRFFDLAWQASNSKGR